jgi:hypothetical protein
MPSRPRPDGQMPTRHSIRDAQRPGRCCLRLRLSRSLRHPVATARDGPSASSRCLRGAPTILRLVPGRGRVSGNAGGQPLKTSVSLVRVALCHPRDALRIRGFPGRATLAGPQSSMLPSLECEPHAGGTVSASDRPGVLFRLRGDPGRGVDLDWSGRGVMPRRCSGAVAGGRRAYRRRPGGLAKIARS